MHTLYLRYSDIQELFEDFSLMRGDSEGIYLKWSYQMVVATLLLKNPIQKRLVSNSRTKIQHYAFLQWSMIDKLLTTGAYCEIEFGYEISLSCREYKRALDDCLAVAPPKIPTIALTSAQSFNVPLKILEQICAHNDEEIVFTHNGIFTPSPRKNTFRWCRKTLSFNREFAYFLPAPDIKTVLGLFHQSFVCFHHVDETQPFVLTTYDESIKAFVKPLLPNEPLKEFFLYR